ncbi:long-chain fatty acid--CoA ligase [Thiocapsa imhoffii]|uniref:Long-chain fatty acid--CoA ligase n=2 Tax=Thiocapsa imhoffii TaxID=382777 RepID=A0A9X0WEJ7_9GAMM|nr:long-chain fatty acid--CoA ligase [Thiocapsa imhoffii]
MISPAQARTLPGLFQRRVELTPRRVAYRVFGPAGWQDLDWQTLAEQVARWRLGLAREGLEPGDRVAVSLPNGLDWVCFDLASLGLGLITVPLYTTDSPGNLAHILADSDARVLVLDQASRWAAIAARHPDGLARVQRLVCQHGEASAPTDPRVRRLADWLPTHSEDEHASASAPVSVVDPHAVATLVYTSGTTGPPKGVMLSHHNILTNAAAVLQRIPARPSDVFLSFLPLAHAFERTVGYYLPMMAGCRVAHARSVAQLREDLISVRPTVLLSVPRFYDKIYHAIQAKLGERGLKRWLFEQTMVLGWQRFEAAGDRCPKPQAWDRLRWRLLQRLVAAPVLARLGGRMRVAVSGGAPLSATVARCFVGLGLPLTEGYGLTEAGPVVSNCAPADFRPGWVGRALPGVRVRLGPGDVLQVQGPNVMSGYWRQPEATATVLDPDGWLDTGDIGEIRDGWIAIRGRLKEILVTSTGEKIPPADLENALTMDPLIDQAMVVGEGQPYIAVLLVLAPAPWRALAESQGLDPDMPAALASPAIRALVQTRVNRLLEAFPAYAQARALHLSLTPWTIDEGLLTPTMKLKRPALEARFAQTIAELYN